MLGCQGVWQQLTIFRGLFWNSSRSYHLSRAWITSSGRGGSCQCNICLMAHCLLWRYFPNCCIIKLLAENHMPFLTTINHLGRQFHFKEIWFQRMIDYYDVWNSKGWDVYFSFCNELHWHSSHATYDASLVPWAGSRGGEKVPLIYWQKCTCA